MIRRPVLLLLVCFTMHASAGDIFSVYLVRHAEKLAPTEAPGGPALTVCGRQRADALALQLSSVHLTAVFSTDYRRTRETAAPVATRRLLPLRGYDPENLADLAKTLRRSGQDVLVVGHSNTTSVLAGLLVDEDWPELDESEYDWLYQYVGTPDGGKVYRYRQAFRCTR